MVGRAPLAHRAQVHVHQVRGPAGQVVEDVRGVDDGAVAGLGLALQPGQELGAREHVEVDGDLVEQEDGPGPHEAHGELHAAALAVADGAHAPARVDVEHADQLVAAGRVRVATDAAQQLDDANVGPHDGIEHPLQPQVRHALEAVLEGVQLGHGDGARGRKALAREQAQEGGLARAVGADEQGAAARGHRQGDVGHAKAGVGEGVGEVFHLDRGGCLLFGAHVDFGWPEVVEDWKTRLSSQYGAIILQIWPLTVLMSPILYMKG